MNICSILLAIGLANQPAAPNLVGTWRFVEYWDRETADQPKQYPFGEHPLGYIVYDGGGHVFVQIAPTHPPAPNGSYVAYFGTYTIDAAKSVVVHHVVADVRGDYTGTDQPRPFRMSGDELLIGDGKRWLRRLVRDVRP